MAFIVETGAGTPSATSYVGQTEFVNYWVDRGQEYATRTDIASLLIRATDKVESVLRSCTSLEPLTTTQGLLYPISGSAVTGSYTIPATTVTDTTDDETETDPAAGETVVVTEATTVDTYDIPADLKLAVILYARHAITSDLTGSAATTGTTSSTSQVIKREKIGPLEVEYESGTATVARGIGTAPAFPDADAVLKRLIASLSSLGLASGRRLYT